MTDYIYAGQRDRLVLCGQAACECLGLDDNNNAPNDVRDCINKLRRQRADFEIDALRMSEQYRTTNDAAHAEVARLREELRDLKGVLEIREDEHREDIRTFEEFGENASESDLWAELIKQRDEARAGRDRFRFAFNEWIEKTEWVQKSGIGKLGQHRADILTTEVSRLRAENEAQREEAKRIDVVHRLSQSHQMTAIQSLTAERDELKAALLDLEVNGWQTPATTKAIRAENERLKAALQNMRAELATPRELEQARAAIERAEGRQS